MQATEQFNAKSKIDKIKRIRHVQMFHSQRFEEFETTTIFSLFVAEKYAIIVYCSIVIEQQRCRRAAYKNDKISRDVRSSGYILLLLSSSERTTGRAYFTGSRRGNEMLFSYPAGSRRRPVCPACL